MRLSLARDRDRGLATASLSGARMMSLFAAFAGEEGRRGAIWGTVGQRSTQYSKLLLLFRLVFDSHLTN